MDFNSFSLGIAAPISSGWEEDFAPLKNPFWEELFQTLFHHVAGSCPYSKDLTCEASNCLALCVLDANFLETEYDQFFSGNYMFQS